MCSSLHRIRVWWSAFTGCMLVLPVRVARRSPAGDMRNSSETIAGGVPGIHQAKARNISHFQIGLPMGGVSDRTTPCNCYTLLPGMAKRGQASSVAWIVQAAREPPSAPSGAGARIWLVRPAGYCRGSPGSRSPRVSQAPQVDVLVRQRRGIDGNAAADQIRDGLQLTVHLRVLRVTPAVEADRCAYDAVLQIEAEELAALGPAAEDQAVPAGREADVLD